MTQRIAAAALTAATVLGSVLVSASTDQFRHDGTQARRRAREAHLSVHGAWRDAERDMRQAFREARQQVRRAMREARAMAVPAQGKARERDREARAFRPVSPTDDPCARNWGGDRGHACQVRDTRLPAPAGLLTVDASPNGGIRVEGWDQADVLVRAVVQTYGETDAEATAALPQVQVTAAGTHVTADGPARVDGERRSGWSVSFQVWAPRATALALSARNGGIAVRDMRGESRLSTENGGVTLDGVGGQVVGSTRNGGVNVRLAGAGWEGAGLDVETINGGITLAVPAGYSAALEVHTVNGGILTDPPTPTQERRGRDLRTTLGGGGPLLKLRTVNGGVRIKTR